MSIARSFCTIIAGLSVLVSGACGEARAPETPALRLTLTHPDELVVGDGPDYPFGLALAPDGRRVVFPASSERAGGVHQLWMRDLASGILEAVAGTDGGVLPFWSHDGQRVGFFANGKLRVITLVEGRVQDLADAPAPRGGTWDTSGAIIFAPGADSALVRLSPEGRAEPFTTMDPGESSHRFPRLLGAGHVIFFVRAQAATQQGIWITPIEQPGRRKRLVNSDAEGLVVDTSLLYASGDALLAQHIDLDTLTLTGRGQPLGEPVGRGPEHQLFATAGGELLLFGTAQSLRRELRWVDRAGAVIGALGEPMNALDVRIAPNGSDVAVARVDPQLRTLDIWVYEDRRPVPRRLSPAIDADDSPVWSPDGRRVAWVSGRRVVTMRDARGEREEVAVRKFEGAVRVSDWSPDGRWIIVSETRKNTAADIIIVPTPVASASDVSSRDVRSYAEAPFNEHQAVISPDGRWLAYASDESGQFEIYLDSFPSPGRRARLTVGGGAEPRWARDGQALFFRRGAEVHLVRVAIAGAVPEAVSTERLFGVAVDIRAFDVTADGQRFLLNVPAPSAMPGAMTALVHVRSLLPSAP